MEILMTDVGKRVFSQRKLLRYSQEELAEKADISKQTVSMIENGQREIRASNVLKLAEALDVSTDYLLKGIRTDADVLRLDQKVRHLTTEQFTFIESVINSFVTYCDTEK